MVDWYLALKVVHILSAPTTSWSWSRAVSALPITAVGANVTYGFWIARARKEPEHLLHVLSGVKALDDRVANPAYGVLLVTGLLMVWLVDIPLTTPWILTSLVLYVAIALVGLLVFTPRLKRQLALLREEGPSSPEFQQMRGQSTVIGMVLTVLVVAIVVLMVVKPGLWRA